MAEFADAITKKARRRPGPPCSVDEARKQMSPDAQAELDAALAPDSGFSNPQIHDALQGLGFAVGRQTVGMHRRGACRCAADGEVA